MAKLDDFLSKKKETTPSLDLSKAIPNTKEEFRRLFDKIPDFKIKAEKIRLDDIKIKDKKFKFKTGKKDLKVLKEKYTFLDPLPQEMKTLKIEDLVTVPIDWKMLTIIRPKSKIEEDMFSRLVEIGKLEIKTALSDKRSFSLDPQIRKTKNKAGVVEMRVVSCTECGEDFCNGKACSLFSYDCFARVPETSLKATKKVNTTEGTKEEKKVKRKIKRKPRTKKRAKSKSRSKSKSPKKETIKK